MRTKTFVSPNTAVPVPAAGRLALHRLRDYALVPALALLSCWEP